MILFESITAVGSSLISEDLKRGRLSRGGNISSSYIQKAGKTFWKRSGKFWVTLIAQSLNAEAKMQALVGTWVTGSGDLYRAWLNDLLLPMDSVPCPRVSFCGLPLPGHRPPALRRGGTSSLLFSPGDSVSSNTWEGPSWLLLFLLPLISTSTKINQIYGNKVA